MATGIVIQSELGQEFLIGTETANKITIAVDGTSIQKDASGVFGAAPPVWDNVGKTITFPSQNGATAQVIDLSQFVADIYVNGGSFDPATLVLTLTDNDGVTPDITVDLSALLGVSADASNALSNGADGKPFLDNTTAFNVSTDADQILSNGTDNKALLTCAVIKASCLTEQCTSVFGTALFNAAPAV